jgi:hypothetical protein
MDLSKVLAISGKPGLFHLVAQTTNGLVIESFIDGKKSTAFSHEKISTLEEISIYTEDDDIALKDVFKSIYEKLEGKAALSHKSPNNDLKEFFTEVLPNYDKENVYISDIKKVINWYNILLQKEMLDFTEEETAEESSEKTEEAIDTESSAK